MLGKKIILVILLGLSACHTMEGMGRDIQAAGDAITGGAEESRQRINQNRY